MRIVIDLQSAQSSGSRNRGIGNYSLSLTKALIENGDEHDFHIVLNGSFTEAAIYLRNYFSELLPKENVHTWHPVAPAAYVDNSNDLNRHFSELTRETFINSLKPDILLITSFFEGFHDDSCITIGKLGKTYPVAVVVYDFIPLIYKNDYLANRKFRDWYTEKLGLLQEADLFLAISNSSRQEAVEIAALPPERCVTVSTDASDVFRPVPTSAKAVQETLRKYGINKKFVLYTGGIDFRKNVNGLIAAYSKLTSPVQDEHCLVLVCAVRPEDRSVLEAYATRHGVREGDIIITGFVSDEELNALYSSCSLFVFPSLHEGFGLPALEAMRCDAPVIGSNTSSLPEVIGMKEALFDPRDLNSMRSIIEKALTDHDFRKALIDNSRAQAKLFSWDRTAQATLDVFSGCTISHVTIDSYARSEEHPKPKLAYVSPFPPEASGIADYSADLVASLSAFYEIDIITPQKDISDLPSLRNIAIKTPDYLLSHPDHYDRILYHFGNSVFHQHMFDMLNRIPGVVVLHDFFLSGIIAHMDSTGFRPSLFAETLYYSHGYTAAKELCEHQDRSEVIYRYPCNLPVLQKSTGIIVHSNSTSLMLDKWYPLKTKRWAEVPLLRTPPLERCGKTSAKRALGFGASDFLVCSFGMIGITKQNLRLLDSWLASNLSIDRSCYLIFVGENDPGGYGAQMLRRIEDSNVADRIIVTGRVSKDVYQGYLNACDLAVQLRTMSRGETSAAVLDCLNHSIPTIVNANGSMADLPTETVFRLSDEFENRALVAGLEELYSNEAARGLLGTKGKELVASEHEPEYCAKLYHTHIERFYAESARDWPGLIDHIEHEERSLSVDEMMHISRAWGKTFPADTRQRQLLIDVSEIVQRDVGTGIQRVVRNILFQFLELATPEFRIEPIYGSPEHGYRYAREFSSRLFGIDNVSLRDEPVDYYNGDIFFGLDYQPHVQIFHESWYKKLQAQGVEVYFTVYDLLCINCPEYFVEGADALFERWLNVVAMGHGAICISEAVANELRNWLGQNFPHRLENFRVEVAHLGAELDRVQEASEASSLQEIAPITNRCKGSTMFLMVGTLEPRKAHSEVLAAFDKLWDEGEDAHLVIVGKVGWKTEQLTQIIKAHPELNKRLHWYDGISDTLLQTLYREADCLIAASKGEGFGLPLIEAARNDVPILARNIPVFREVAGNKATYFNADKPEELFEAFQRWLRQFRCNEHIKPNGMSWLNWRQSAEQFLSALMRNRNGERTNSV
ncbi:glycosyltransferase [Nitratireductor basaltis]|uniref:Glycosyltransferase n=1 Tax=Nitratireductor basaltis TaxID=472175 RepID=A0A084UD04_9HYPH|nr:glycosyltransferase [Nitratireductor basaltis]KFB10840.1 Glycosyltransferase [Nitratireductor basaltis]